MERVIRRAMVARNQAKRKARIAAKKQQHEELRDMLRSQFQLNRLKIDAEREEKKNRWEDWMRGPLAPKRDAGAQASHYGAITPMAVQPPKIPKHLRRQYINIAPGDRVCLMKGKDKGKIGEVVSVDEETEHVTVKDLNMVDVHIPPWLNEEYGSKRPFNAMELPIPIDDVRLVVPLEDPATGTVRDVIVEKVTAGGPFIERPYGSRIPKHTRYIAGENIEIPWPADKPNFKDEEWDTLRMEVETPTWVPSLQYAPFESSILDELRNKYSKYRIRHDPEWAEAKRLEDLKEEYRKSRTLLTPRTEWLAQKQAQAAEERKKKLDKDGNYIMDEQTADFIANFMKSKGKATEA
ncbi:hypothetical protein VTN49DRAFT_7830 [Thermomyces lanuginosus]|uniref:mitochondrial 54S ribosomal protein uL24m n=1 Tax=Thermomyces lanuginosus TaxID=5541 RepID=UPI00374367EA